MPGAPPPSEPRAFPEALDCLLSVHSIIHQSHARKFAAGLAARKKPLVCFALRSAAFGLLLRALRSLSLLARACAGPRCRALAVRGGRAGVQWRVAACKSAVRSWCNVVQCCANVACVVPCVHARWVNRDRTDPSSCVHAGTSRKSAAPRPVVCFCALVGAVCHCGHTTLQPAHLRARGGQGVASARCRGRARAGERPMRRVAAWPASVCWASGAGGTPWCFGGKTFFSLSYRSHLYREVKTFCLNHIRH